MKNTESNSSAIVGSMGAAFLPLPVDPLPQHNQHPLLMKQDPVLISNDLMKEEDDVEDSHNDFM